MTGINGLGDLRPGDICFTRIGGFVPGIVPVGLGQLMLGERVRIGRLRFDHVGIVVQAAMDGLVSLGGHAFGAPMTPPRMVQAMPDGAEEIDLRQDTHWNPWTVYARLPEDYPGQGADAAAAARKMVEVGVDYSFASYAMLAAHRYGIKTPRLEARIARRRRTTRIQFRRGLVARELPVEAICSVLVDQAWTLADHKVMHGVSPQVVTPGGLGMQLWHNPAVEWGGEALLG